MDAHEPNVYTKHIHRMLDESNQNIETYILEQMKYTGHTKVLMKLTTCCLTLFPFVLVFYWGNSFLVNVFLCDSLVPVHSLVFFLFYIFLLLFCVFRLFLCDGRLIHEFFLYMQNIIV